MNKSSRKSDKRGKRLSKPSSVPKLELPDGWRFALPCPPVGLDQMIRFCEERLPFFNSRPGAEEQRLREKCNVPFEL